MHMIKKTASKSSTSSSKSLKTSEMYQRLMIQHICSTIILKFLCSKDERGTELSSRKKLVADSVNILRVLLLHYYNFGRGPECVCGNEITAEHGGRIRQASKKFPLLGCAKKLASLCSIFSFRFAAKPGF